LHELLEDFRGFLHIRCHRWLNASLADAAAMLSYGALQRLLALAFPDEERSALCPALLKGLPGVVTSEAVDELWELAQMIRVDADLDDLLKGATPAEFLAHVRGRAKFAAFRVRWDSFLERWGFRRSGELMLTVPGFQENPAELVGILRAVVRADGASPAKLLKQQDAERRDATARVTLALRRRGIRRLLPWPSKATLFQLLLKATHCSVAQRERARLKQALLYNRCRRIVLAIGAKLAPLGYLETADDIFNLTYQEIDRLLAGGDMFAHQVKELVALRRAGQARLHALIPPDSFELEYGAYLDFNGPVNSPRKTNPVAGTESVLSGVGVCCGCVTAPAAILQDVAESERLQPGYVLVTRQTDPGWGPIFPLVKGLVIERGGMLSHGAILAREYGIPAVVGVEDATRRIAQGQTITVNGDRGLVELVP
jgi:phosphohistidine swiveling domain-containing protein